MTEMTGSSTSGWTPWSPITSRARWIASSDIDAIVAALELKLRELRGDRLPLPADAERV